MTNINDLKSAALAADTRHKEAVKKAKDLEGERSEATQIYNTAAAEAAGMTAYKAIVEFPEYGWSIYGKKRGVVVGPSATRVDVVAIREVTKKNKIWGGRNIHFCAISKCELTGETLAEEKNDD